VLRVERGRIIVTVTGAVLSSAIGEEMQGRFTIDDALLFATALIWAANYSVVKAALEELPPLAFNALRFGAAASILLAITWVVEGRPAIGGLWRRIVVLGLVGNTAYQLLFVIGISLTGASQASLFAAITPVWVLIIGRATGHGRISFSAVVGIGLTVLGVVLLFRESLVDAAFERGYWVGDLMFVAAAFCWAWYTVQSRPLLRDLTPLSLSTTALVVGAIPIVLLGAPALATVDPGTVSTAAWAGTAYACLFPIVVAYLIWHRAVQRIGPTRTAVYLNLVPLMAVAIARWSLGEELTSIQLVGGALVIAGIWITRASGGGRLGSAAIR
jgi:drug/metabolite transporter (DMT)-like permease